MVRYCKYIIISIIVIAAYFFICGNEIYNQITNNNTIDDLFNILIFTLITTSFAGGIFYTILAMKNNNMVIKCYHIITTLAIYGIIVILLYHFKEHMLNFKLFLTYEEYDKEKVELYYFYRASLAVSLAVIYLYMKYLKFMRGISENKKVE